MTCPEIVIISALSATNRVIGRAGKLPWDLPDDMARFNQLTRGYSVILGRNTWDTDLERCPLSDRRHIIVSRSLTPDDLIPTCPDRSWGLVLVRSLTEAFDAVAGVEKAFVIGGASIYQQALDRADTLELTLVQGEYEGDTFFPPYEHLIGPVFQPTWSAPQQGYCFNTYRRRSVRAATAAPVATPAP